MSLKERVSNIVRDHLDAHHERADRAIRDLINGGFSSPCCGDYTEQVIAILASIYDFPPSREAELRRACEARTNLIQAGDRVYMSFRTVDDAVACYEAITAIYPKGPTA